VEADRAFKSVSLLSHPLAHQHVER